MRAYFDEEAGVTVHPMYMHFACTLVTNEMHLTREVRCTGEDMIPAGVWFYVAHVDGRPYVFCPQHWAEETDAIAEGMRVLVCKGCGRDSIEEIGEVKPTLCVSCFEQRLTSRFVGAAIDLGFTPDRASAMGERLQAHIHTAEVAG